MSTGLGLVSVERGWVNVVRRDCLCVALVVGKIWPIGVADMLPCISEAQFLLVKRMLAEVAACSIKPLHVA